MQFVIVDNECKFIIDKRVYNIPTIMKAAYMYIDENYLFFDVLSLITHVSCQQLILK